MWASLWHISVNFATYIQKNSFRVGKILKNVIPLWILVVVFVKELLMVSGASFLYGKKLVVSSKWYGKLTTVLFYIAIVCSFIVRVWNGSLFGHPEYSLPLLPDFDQYIYYLALHIV